jgi:hypothetical protein
MWVSRWRFSAARSSRVASAGGRRGSEELHIQLAVAADARGDEPPGDQLQRQPQEAQRWRQGLRLAQQGAAEVTLRAVVPDQCAAGAVAASAQQHPQRAGFGQAADAAAVAGLAGRGFGWRPRVDVDDLLSLHGCGCFGGSSPPHPAGPGRAGPVLQC